MCNILIIDIFLNYIKLTGRIKIYKNCIVIRIVYFYFQSEVTTFVIMIIGSLEFHVLKLRRIRGALLRLVLLPLTVEVFTFILVYTKAEAKNFLDIMDVKLIPYCG